MNLIEFAKSETNNNLTYFQLDVLELLEREPDAWQPKLKPATHEMRQLLNIVSKWKERQNSLVAC